MKGLDPRSVANLIIQEGLNRELSLSNLSVQKILYFCHASFLAKFSKPLVFAPFEAWEYGPVCRPVYDQLKGYGRNPIDKLITKIDVFSGEVQPIPLPEDPFTCEHIVDLVRNLGALSPSALVQLSHAKGGAWEKVWEQSKHGPTIGNRISDTLSKERYFCLKLDLDNQKLHGDIDEATPFAGD